MSSTTTHYSLVLPAVNSATDEDLWGDELNADMVSIDSLIYTATNSVPRVVTGTDTATTTDSNKILLCDATSAAFTENLPTAASAGSGFKLYIMKTDATAHAVTIDGSGSETINGATTYALSAQYNVVELVCDGTNWKIAASNIDLTVPDATTSVKGIIQIATNAEVTTGSNATKAVVPSAVIAHHGVAKAWASFSGNSGSILSSYGITSVTRTGTGSYTIVFSTAFANANYVLSGAAGDNSVRQVLLARAYASTWSTTTAYVQVVRTDSGGAVDSNYVYVVFHGDQ